MKDKYKSLVSIAHLCILISFPGLLLALTIYFLEKDNSEFIKRGVKQAIGLQSIVAACILIYRTGRIFGLFNLSGLLNLGFPFAYAVIAATAIYAAHKSYKGIYYRYPLIGKFIEDIGNQI